MGRHIINHTIATVSAVNYIAQFTRMKPTVVYISLIFNVTLCMRNVRFNSALTLPQYFIIMCSITHNLSQVKVRVYYIRTWRDIQRKFVSYV